MCQVVLLKTLERDSELHLGLAVFVIPSIKLRGFTQRKTGPLKNMSQISVHSPYNYDDEVQQIPAVP